MSELLHIIGQLFVSGLGGASPRLARLGWYFVGLFVMVLVAYALVYVFA